MTRPVGRLEYLRPSEVPPMGMVMLRALLPHVARAETRSVLMRGHPKLPDNDYTFAEVYCVDDGCDCRRVIFNVFGDRRREWLATINYAFDEDDPEPGPFLDPLNPQSEQGSRRASC